MVEVTELARAGMGCRSGGPVLESHPDRLT
ncbi:hypothetical protein SEEHN189_10459, partial [Salmonella enterica subsp. enterica serovar Heidelberg str. N189]